MPRRPLAECTPQEIAERAHVQIAFGTLPAYEMISGLQLCAHVRDKEPIPAYLLAWLQRIEESCSRLSTEEDKKCPQ